MKENSKPQSRYIYINSINDIDLKKLSIKDLNKKFIDARGRRYALKFDFVTRSVKVVHLASSYEEALRIQKEPQSEKREEYKIEHSLEHGKKLSLYQKRKEILKIHWMRTILR